jgi:hypothetical protein
MPYRAGILESADSKYHDCRHLPGTRFYRPTAGNFILLSRYHGGIFTARNVILMGIVFFFDKTSDLVQTTIMQLSGDIANLPFSGNYTPKLQGSENIGSHLGFNTFYATITLPITYRTEENVTDGDLAENFRGKSFCCRKNFFL